MSSAPQRAARTGIDDVCEVVVIGGGPAGSAAHPAGRIDRPCRHRPHTGYRAAVLTALAAGCVVGASGNARADQPLWELGLGVAGLRLPHYRGSDQARTWLLPVPYAVYRGEIFKADREGARAVLLTSDRVDFDLSFSASAPTSNDNRARCGMPDLKPTLEFGPNLNLSLARTRNWELQLRLPVRTVVTLQSHPRGVGFQAAPHLNLDWRVADWNFGLQGGPLWGDHRRHAFFYDVAPIYATDERPAYRARGGFAGWNGVASLSRRFSGTWAGLYVRADSLDGAVFDDSPLVKSRFNWSAGVALSWVFKTSEQRVRDDDLPGSRP